MRYKSSVSKNLDNIKITLDMTIRLLQNNNIKQEEVINNLTKIQKKLESTQDMVQREEETR